MWEYLLTVVIALIFVIAFIYGFRFAKFAVKRLWFAFRLFLMSIFCKGFEYCYKVPWSIFSGRKNKCSDILVYYGGTVYIIKLVGFFKKRTNVIVNKENIWQLDTYVPLGKWLVGTKNTDVEVVKFNLPGEKTAFENSIWNVPNISKINTMILLLPKPRDFGVRVATHIEWLCSGNLCGGNIVGTVRYFWKNLKELKEDSENFMYIEKNQWDTIKKEYKKAKWF